MRQRPGLFCERNTLAIEDVGDDYTLAAQVGHLLRRANQRHTTLFSELFAPYGLTTLQFAALMVLAESGDVSQNQLGRMTAMDPNTIQGVVQRLERRGLVEREHDSRDRRRVLLRLSAEGKAMATDLVSLGHDISQRTLAPLSAPEREAFLQALHKLA